MDFRSYISFFFKKDDYISKDGIVVNSKKEIIKYLKRGKEILISSGAYEIDCNVLDIKTGTINIINANLTIIGDNFTINAYGTSKVVSRGSNIINAYDYATIIGYGHTEIMAYDNSDITGYDNSKGTIRGNSKLQAHKHSNFLCLDNVNVIATEDARIRASDNCVITAYNDSDITATGNCTITAYQHSKVMASGGTINANNYSIITYVSGKKGEVYGYDNCHIKMYGSGTLWIYNLAIVVLFSGVKVNAYGAATIIKNTSTSRISAKSSNVIIRDKIKNCTIKSDQNIGNFPKNKRDWCLYYGLEIDDQDVVILYKAVNSDFASPWGTFYLPETKPYAPDWDNGEKECGGGLHFSPTPRIALKFNSKATKFVGCPVNLRDMVYHDDPHYFDKIKAKCVYGPCFEVDIDGNIKE